MAEPTSSTAAVVISAAGLSFFGIATGLHPMLLIAGLAGGWWSLSFQAPMTLGARLTSMIISALVAGWLAPVLVAALVGQVFVPRAVTGDLLQFPVALLVGFLTHTALGPGLIALLKRKLENA